MPLRGLQPHTRADRTAIIEQLVPLFQRKFGDSLIAIAADASYARGEDQAYSDLEMIVFLKEPLPEGEDRYMQRVVDGMLVEVMYYTPDAYVRQNTTLTPEWHIAASDVLLPVLNAPAVEDIARRVKAVQHPREKFMGVAAQKYIETQECFSKVLNAVEQNNTEGVGMVLFDAVLQLLITLSLVNQRPFTTFAAFVRQARLFPVKPARFDDLLDIVVQGHYQDMSRLREVVLAVCAGMEQIFEQAGIRLFDESIDPNLPNRHYDRR